MRIANGRYSKCYEEDAVRAADGKKEAGPAAGLVRGDEVDGDPSGVRTHDLSLRRRTL